MWIVVVVYKVYGIKVLFARKLLGLLSLDNDDIISHIYTIDYYSLDNFCSVEVESSTEKLFSASFPYRGNPTKNAALQRSAMFIETLWHILALQRSAMC